MENYFYEIECKLQKNRFLRFNELDIEKLQSNGFYFLRIKEKSKLPLKYNNILEKRDNRIIYIGKAENQSLKDRLDQEILHTKPGTFFRSIGCVLVYFPIKGHLKNKCNKYNYKFSKEDTKKITEWLLENIEICILNTDEFHLEKDLINKYRPLLNQSHNPFKLKELEKDRKKCIEIARS
jgi:hypothetical protein